MCRQSVWDSGKGILFNAQNNQVTEKDGTGILRVLTHLENPESQGSWKWLGKMEKSGRVGENMFLPVVFSVMYTDKRWFHST